MSQVRKPDTAFRKPKRKRAISAVDSIFSLCVREAADNTCVRCGVTKHNAQIQCSHLWSRRMRSGRWNPDNAVAHCAACHRFLGENPVKFQEWIEEYKGNEYEEWYSLSLRIVKVSAVLREDIYQHYKAEHARLMKLRDEGVEGPIELRGIEL